MAVIEIIRFQLNDRTPVEVFLKADARVTREYMQHRPGLEGRQTAQDQADWVIIVQWRNLASAEASMATYKDALATAAQLACMEEGSMTMQRFEVRAELPSALAS